MKKYQSLEIEISNYSDIDAVCGSPWETPDAPLFPEIGGGGNTPDQGL